jgi:cytochrome c556
MIIRIALVATAAFACMTSATAQSSLLPSTTLMRSMGSALYRDMTRMARGEDPFDQAKAQAAISRLIEDSKKTAGAFPETSKGKVSPETRYSASPKVWEDKAGFNTQIDRLAKALQENSDKVKTLDGLKAANTAINAACNGCHEGFRVRRN